MIKWNGFMIFKKYSQTYKGLNARLTKTSPRLDVGEVAVKVCVDLPKELFERPMLQANISVSKDVIPESIIDAQVQDNVEKVIKEVTGAEIKFTLVDITEPKPEEESEEEQSE